MNRMKKYFLVVFFVFWAVSLAIEPVRLDSNQIVKGTVVHIFEDFANPQDPQRIAKVKIANAPANKDLSLVDVSGNMSLTQGDSILISQVQTADTFGMGDSFESKFAFLDFARDNGVWVVLGSLAVLMFLANTAMLLPVAGIGGLLTMLVLVAALTHWRVPELYTILVVLIGSMGIIHILFPTRKYWVVVVTTVAGVLLTTLFYNVACHALHLDNYLWISRTSLVPLVTEGLVRVQRLGFVLAASFLYAITMIFFVRISSYFHILDAFRRGVVGLLGIYLPLAIGITLPMTMLYSLNGLDSLYLFNYVPFVSMVVFFTLLLWGNILTFALYSFWLYVYFRRNPHAHGLPLMTKAPQVTLDHILKDDRVSRYHEPNVRRKKAKVTETLSRPKPKRLTREHSRRI
jgi:hypothetical protein